MKFLRSTLLVAAAACIAARVEAQGLRIAHDAGVMLLATENADETPSSFLRRGLQAGSDTGTTAPPSPTTTAPPPPTTTAPPPTTTAPPPTTTAPPVTTEPPATTEPPTTTTEPPATTTPAPTSTSTEPATTTPAPSSTETTTPEPTTAGPATVKPSTSGSDSADGSNGGLESSSSSADGANTDKLTDSSSNKGGAATTTTDDSKMGTGTIIAIVGGIVVGVGILAIIAVVLARKRRDEDDDPLSPFELSMDKGYNGAASGGYGGQQQNQYQSSNNQFQNATASGAGYNGGRPGSNSVAMLGGAAAVGAGAGVGAGMMMDTNTPHAGADGAGVSYTQFYDPVTSPDSMYPPNQQPYDDRTNATRANDASVSESNLWMSAMEPKENDVEGMGASVPPDVSLPADNSSFVSRDSYGALPGASVDIDQSSVLSGSSDLDKDFPDYEDESARGSYEL